MDFDPGEIYEEGYDEGFADNEPVEENSEEKVEYDSLGNPIFLAAAGAFGYHMAEDSLEEREIAEDLLKKRERRPEEPIKVPLSSRHATTSDKRTPFLRWAEKVNKDPDRREESIDYTLEEQLQIIDSEWK